MNGPTLPERDEGSEKHGAGTLQECPLGEVPFADAEGLDSLRGAIA